MGQRFQINHFWNFTAYASAILKDDGLQYKCHNISKNASPWSVMLAFLVSLCFDQPRKYSEKSEFLNTVGNVTRNVNVYVRYTWFRRVRSNDMVNVWWAITCHIHIVEFDVSRVFSYDGRNDLRRCVNCTCKGKSGTSMSPPSKSLKASRRSRVLKHFVPLAHYPISLDVSFLFSQCGISAVKLV